MNFLIIYGMNFELAMIKKPLLGFVIRKVPVSPTMLPFAVTMTRILKKKKSIKTSAPYKTALQVEENRYLLSRGNFNFY